MSSVCVVCLHFLGGSARTFDLVAAKLAADIGCEALDLPGFGGASSDGGGDVAKMADGVSAAIRDLGLTRYWIVGHSMGAKVALAVARRAEDGGQALAGLALIAGSPPAPEPIPEDKRADMLGWVDQPDKVRQTQASAYIADNVGIPLEPDIERRAVADVLRANPAAWKRWLAEGSREDWRERIGWLKTPALIVSGSRDMMLGSTAQARLMAPHLARHRCIELDGAGHLLPLERPDDIAKLLTEAVRESI